MAVQGGYEFQFYDSPIKSCDGEAIFYVHTRFNSMIVRLKEP